MSERYVTVQWNKKKVLYDLFVLAFVILYTQLFQAIGSGLFEEGQRIDWLAIRMRAWGTCAFLMLTGILLIGPLTRLDRRFAPILYNRRHFGVIFFFVATWHAKNVIDQYHAWGIITRLESLLTFDAAFTPASLPFQLFGAAALIIFFVMAATSHDYWQNLLGARLWKSLHMSVYLAYALVITHVAFGALQHEHHPVWILMVSASVLSVGSLHWIAALRTRANDGAVAELADAIGDDETRGEVPWLDAGPAAQLVLDRPVVVNGPEGESIALVRHKAGISALHGVCAHQGGPLGEGRVLDGCLTCPWHGWQYAPSDGQAPPPFTEKISTYRVHMDARRHVLIDPRPLPPGTRPAGNPLEANAEPGSPEQAQLNPDEEKPA